MAFKSKLIEAPRLATALAVAVALYAPSAHATAQHTVSGPQDDPYGDILTTFSGDKAHSPDLDVRHVDANYDFDSITLTARMWGDIGTTSNGLYIWGVDRGAGTPFLDNLPGPKIGGPDITFDSFIQLNNDGTGMVVAFNPVPGSVTGTPDVFNFTAGQIKILGDTITVDVPRAWLPSKGADISQYGFNMWPRIVGTGNNSFVSDFAPDQVNMVAGNVPEPATWALMIMGFGLVGATLRRRPALTA
jgi:hypothetical protein